MLRFVGEVNYSIAVGLSVGIRVGSRFLASAFQLGFPLAMHARNLLYLQTITEKLDRCFFQDGEVS